MNMWPYNYILRLVLKAFNQIAQSPPFICVEEGVTFREVMKGWSFSICKKIVQVRIHAVVFPIDLVIMFLFKLVYIANKYLLMTVVLIMYKYCSWLV